MSAKRSLLAIFLILLACAGPSLALFGPPTATYTGRVNFIQANNFTVLTDNNELFRVMVPPDKRLPAEVQLGIKVVVKAVQGQDGLWYLDKFQKIETLPEPGQR